jgi:regulation of enolase protein 1 (concanavalin A-like superfamily)
MVVLFLPAYASAETVAVTAGFMDLQPTRGPFYLSGDHGFTFQSFVSESNALLFASKCNDDPLHCLPGTSLNLGVHATGGDLSGIATFEGITYRRFGGIDSFNNLAFDFTGSVVLPPLAPSAVITVPITFTGVLTHTIGSTETTTTETLNGSGVVTVSLVASQIFPGSWRVVRLVYSLNQSLPTGWLSSDVGFVSLPGDATFSSGTFDIKGSGDDIWGPADSFRFTYQPLASDGIIVARVDNVPTTHPSAKAGVMLRQSADASAAEVILDVKPDGGIEFMTRAVAGGDTEFIGGSFQTGQVWLRLTRTGLIVTGSVSSDGTAWTVIGTATFPTQSGLIGLAVTSHDNAQLAQALFSEVSIAASTLPSPWSAIDIGAVGAAGSATYDGTFTVKGDGADIWGTADAFMFVHQSIEGNTQVSAHVLSLDPTDTRAKAGVMLRETLEPSSAHVILAVLPGGFVEFMMRPATGAETTFITGVQASFPVSLRLERTGSLVTGYVMDGSTWTALGSVNVSFQTRLEAGLAVTSHAEGTLTTGTFNQVSVMSGTGAFQSQDVGDVGISGGVLFANSTYTVAGAGADIWGTEDSFQFAYMPMLSFNTVFVARVVSVQNTNPFAKAGIMIRESLAANAAHVILDLRPTGDIEFMIRSATGMQTQYLAGATAAAGPVWLRLTIDGPNTVTGWMSMEPNTWTPVGTATIPIGAWSAPLEGLVVTSHDRSQVNTAVFDRTP